MNEKLATFFERLAAGKAAQRILNRMGLDPRQFVLFLRLFRTLSERGEFAGAIGVNRFSIAYLALYAAAIGFIPWLGFAAFLPALIFLLVNLATVFPTVLQAMLFRNWWAALLSAIALAVLAWFVVRWDLGGLEQEMCWRLHIMKMGPNRMFKVIE